MQATKEKVVTIDYTLKDDEGEVLDTSDGREPVAYLHGGGNIVPGLETALEGKAKGDSLSVSVSPADGYGEHDPGMIQPVPRENFPADAPMEIGMQFQAESPAGPRVVTIVKMDDKEVTVDANHPLAGKQLNFAVTIVDVRDATAEEIEHGHAHGAGGHDHGH